LEYSSPGFEEGIQALAYSTDGKALVTAGPRGEVKSWDLTKRKVKTLLSARDGPIPFLVLGPEGRNLAIADDHGQIQVWDVYGQRLITTLPRQEARIGCLVFAADGKSLAVAYRGDSPNPDSIVVWQISGRKRLAAFDNFNSPVHALAFSAEGRSLASGGGRPDGSGEIHIWDIKTRREEASLPGHTDPVTAVAFSPDRGILATGGQDHAIHLWDLEKTQSPKATLRGHLGPLTTLRFSADGKTLVSGSQDGEVKVWDPFRPPADRSLQGHTQTINGLAFSDGGQSIVSVGGAAGKPGEIIHWDLKEFPKKMSPQTGSPESLRCVASDSAGKALATGDEGGTIRVWRSRGQEPWIFSAHDGPVQALAFAGENLLASAGRDKLIKLWDYKKEKRLAVLTSKSPVLAIAVTPDGDMLAAACENSAVELWNPLVDKLLRTFEGHTDAVTCVAFSPADQKNPAGKYLATGSKDRTVRIWATGDGRLLARLNGHGHWVLGLTYSPSGDILASASRDGTVRLWYPKVGQEEQLTLEGGGGWLTAVAFSPDGKTLAAACSDKTVKVWQAAKDDEVPRRNDGN
jgi:WD40 repeat protein